VPRLRRRHVLLGAITQPSSINDAIDKRFIENMPPRAGGGM
jgi:hypothetical protein